MIKLEIFLSKAQRAEPIGTAFIYLRDLVEVESRPANTSKQQVIHSFAQVCSVKDNRVRIGAIKYKIRMRKSLKEALRWYNEKNDLLIQPERILDGGIVAHSLKKVVSISVVEVQNLPAKFGETPCPFFFYQFYKFDENYSPTLKGRNLIYNHTKTFEIEFDSKFKEYVSTQRLELFFFDDSAPMMEEES